MSTTKMAGSDDLPISRETVPDQPTLKRAASAAPSRQSVAPPANGLPQLVEAAEPFKGDQLNGNDVVVNPYRRELPSDEQAWI